MSSIEERFTFEQVRGFMDSPDTDWTKDLTDDIFGPGDLKAEARRFTFGVGGPHDLTYASKEDLLKYLHPLMAGAEMRRYVDDLEDFCMRYVKSNGWMLTSFAFGMIFETKEIYALVFAAPEDTNRRRRGTKIHVLIGPDVFRAGARLTWEQDYERLSRSELIEFVQNDK
jgi:hypothetical protein